ncbi:MAG: PEP-CTERM sorting domain-containing protein [Burkholderiaceae bacterium]|nr:PEP-CTERM sorting domain-containing protein [Burkholderiaceae bacterium]
MTRQFIKPLLTACLALCAAHAQASVVQFQGFAHGSEYVEFSLSSSAYQGTQAGGFNVLLNGSMNIATYCVDLLQHINLSGSYNDFTQVNGSAHLFANSRANDDINRLFTSAGELVHDATTEAAFQLAVWELAYETDTDYSLNDGIAKFHGSIGAVGFANDWLSHLGSKTSVNLQVLESRTFQDQVFANRVPEPSSAALIVAAMMGLGAVQRRRKRAAD